MNGLKNDLGTKYINGFALGSNGQKLPTNLNDTSFDTELLDNLIILLEDENFYRQQPLNSQFFTEKIKPYFNLYTQSVFTDSAILEVEPVDPNQDQTKVDFRQGVFDGIEALLEMSGTSTAALFLNSTVATILSDESAVMNYNNGLKRLNVFWGMNDSTLGSGKIRSTRSSFNQGLDLEDDIINFENSDSTYSDNKAATEDVFLGITGLDHILSMLTTRNAYSLGFIAGVLVDKGVLMQPSEVPLSFNDLVAFNQGYNAETSPVQEKEEDLYTLLHVDKMEFKLDSCIGHSESAYKTGLSVWMKSIGAGVVPVEVIRDPKALEAFKAEYLKEEEPTYITGDISNSLKSDLVYDTPQFRLLETYFRSNVQSGAPLNARGVFSDQTSHLKLIDDPVKRGREAAVYAKDHVLLTIK
jgi:hypothetical protein